jgi:hypothetical protein
MGHPSIQDEGRGSTEWACAFLRREKSDDGKGARRRRWNNRDEVSSSDQS